MAIKLKPTNALYSVTAIYEDGREEFLKDYLFKFFYTPYANKGLALIAIHRKLRKDFGKDVNFSSLSYNLDAIADYCTLAYVELEED